VRATAVCTRSLIDSGTEGRRTGRAELEQLRADYRQDRDQPRRYSRTPRELRTTHRAQLEASQSPTAVNLARLHRPRVYLPPRRGQCRNVQPSNLPVTAWHRRLGSVAILSGP
jgi:hypothetical protein